MSEVVPNFDSFIAIDKRAVRVYLAFSGLVILFGFFIAAASFTNLVVFTGDDRKWLQEVGGGLIAAFSAFPIAKFLARLDRIGLVRAIQNHWQQILSTPGYSKAELDRLKERFWKLYDKEGAG